MTAIRRPELSLLPPRPAALVLMLALSLAALGSPAEEAAAAPGASGLTPAAGAFADSVREIPVTIVTDSAYRRTHRWRELARRAVIDGTADLPDAVGLRFVPSEELTWELAGEVVSMEQILNDAMTAVGPRPGLTAVFTGLRPERTGQWSELGYAFLGRPALVLSVPRREEIPFASHLGKELTHYFRHELGHVFGVPHLDGPNVMTDDPDRRDWAFGDVGLDILRANRLIDFASASPFTDCDLETLRDAYLFLDDRGECEPALLINLGVAFHRERRPEEARALFEAGLRRERDSVAGRLGLAQTLLDLGDTLTVRPMVQSLSAEGKLGGQAQGVLGGLWIRLGDPARARDMLTEALAADSTRFSTWFHRGLASFRLEDHERARADFERALEVEERPEGWFNLGLAYDALDDGDGVRRAMTRFLEMAPDGARADDARMFLERRQ